jgi:uncharacterized membrane protein
MALHSLKRGDSKRSKNMERKETKSLTLWMAQTALLSAIIIIMAFTPLGYLKAGPIEITFIMIPVAIGAILLGPKTGLLLGAVFGITSFIQCFGYSWFGANLLQISPFYTFILCMVPRMLMGWLVGLIFQALHKVDRTKFISFAVASLGGAVLNTVLFVGGLVLFFGNSDFLHQFGDTIPAIIAVLVTINAALEAAVCLVIGTAITKPLYRIVNKLPA